jgi:DNA-binding LytR/AlgR family response regulator
MIRIAICDDEEYFIKRTKDALMNYQRENGILYEIDTYSSGKELVAMGIELAKYTIIFLDINMDEIDGIMTARKIREVSREIFIVFVTAYVNYTLEGYKVDAVRYLLKDNANFQGSINECLDAITEKLNYTVVKKRFNFVDGEREVSIERLLYIESKLHRLDFHVMEENLRTYVMYDTLNKIEDRLRDYDFVRVHQSYLVNLKFIKSVDRYKVVLTNGIELTVPKARYGNVKSKFIAYRGEV